jgi:hypothetical protein
MMEKGCEVLLIIILHERIKLAPFVTFSLCVVDVELLLARCLLVLQFIHEVKLATMEGLFEFSGKRKESKRYKCLDVLFWQFKHIKLIFIYVGLRRGQTQKAKTLHFIAGWFSGRMMKSFVVAFNLTSSCHVKTYFIPHGTIKTFQFSVLSLSLSFP